LVRTRAGVPLPPSLVFGESKVTTNMIQEYDSFAPRRSRRS
jgi:hypothetical protein